MNITLKSLVPVDTEPKRLRSTIV